MNRKRFFKGLGLVAVFSVIKPSVLVSFFSKLKPKPIGLYGLPTVQSRMIRLWALRQNNVTSILKIIHKKSNIEMIEYPTWKFRYPEFEEI